MADTTLQKNQAAAQALIPFTTPRSGSKSPRNSPQNSPRRFPSPERLTTDGGNFYRLSTTDFIDGWPDQPLSEKFTNDELLAPQMVAIPSPIPEGETTFEVLMPMAATIMVSSVDDAYTLFENLGLKLDSFIDGKPQHRPDTNDVVVCLNGNHWIWRISPEHIALGLLIPYFPPRTMKQFAPDGCVVTSKTLTGNVLITHSARYHSGLLEQGHQPLAVFSESFNNPNFENPRTGGKLTVFFRTSADRAAFQALPLADAPQAQDRCLMFTEPHPMGLDTSALLISGAHGGIPHKYELLQRAREIAGEEIIGVYAVGSFNGPIRNTIVRTRSKQTRDKLLEEGRSNRWQGFVASFVKWTDQVQDFVCDICRGLHPTSAHGKGQGKRLQQQAPNQAQKRNKSSSQSRGRSGASVFQIPKELEDRLRKLEQPRSKSPRADRLVASTDERVSSLEKKLDALLAGETAIATEATKQLSDRLDKMEQSNTHRFDKLDTIIMQNESMIRRFDTAWENNAKIISALARTVAKDGKEKTTRTDKSTPKQLPATARQRANAASKVANSKSDDIFVQLSDISVARALFGISPEPAAATQDTADHSSDEDESDA